MRAWRAALLGAVLATAGCDAVLGLHPPPAPADAAPGAPYWSFSDDFELGDLRRWTQPVRAPNGTLDVATQGAHAGCCALHAALDASGVGYEYALLAWPQASPPAPPVTSGTIAVRAWVEASALDPDTRELTIVEGGTSATAYVTAGLGASGASPGFAWGFLVSDPADANFSRQSADVRTDVIGSWHCIELVLVVGEAGHVSIFKDGSPVPEIDGAVDTRPATGWDSVTIGLGYASGAAESDVRIDDVEVALYDDTSPTIHIGCTPP